MTTGHVRESWADPADSEGITQALADAVARVRGNLPSDWRKRSTNEVLAALGWTKTRRSDASRTFQIVDENGIELGFHSAHEVSAAFAGTARVLP